MSYCTASDITLKYTTYRIAQLSGDPLGVTVNTQVVEQAIAFATALMKPFVRKYERDREVVAPFTAAQETLNSLCVELAYYELLKRSPVGLTEEDNRQINRLMDLLKAIANGEVELQDVSVNPAPEITQSAWSGRARIFNREVALT
jgi:phage gp36-like protein